MNPSQFRLVFGVAGVTLGVGLAFWLMTAAKSKRADSAGPPPGPTRQGESGLPQQDLPVRALAVGTKAPPIEAAGWLNGSPPRVGAGGPRLILVDLWAHW
jgi:hypothetical protein